MVEIVGKEVTMAYIEVINPHEAGPQLKAIYEELILSRGKLAEVHKIQSLNPDTIIRHMDLYQSLMFGKSPLKRYQREMIAVVVSVANNCEYCIRHHVEALRHFWHHEEMVRKIAADYQLLDLDQRDRVLCDLAHRMTVNLPEMQDDVHLAPLREAGYTDRAILDATLITSYFNFVNRIVLGLGVTSGDDEVKGYKYE